MKLGRYTKRAILGGVISMIVMPTGILLLGEMSGYEAKFLIKNSISGINMIALASATILALLLTVLDINSSLKSHLKENYNRHILEIARLGTAIFVSAGISFLLFYLSVMASENLPSEWFSTVYYISLAISSILSTALIVVVLMLSIPWSTSSKLPVSIYRITDWRLPMWSL